MSIVNCTKIMSGYLCLQRRLSQLSEGIEIINRILPYCQSISALSSNLASYTQALIRARCALPSRNKGLVSTVLRMCQFKTNEYTQTTLLGVELLHVTFYV